MISSTDNSNLELRKKNPQGLKQVNLLNLADNRVNVKRTYFKFTRIALADQPA